MLRGLTLDFQQWIQMHRSGIRLGDRERSDYGRISRQDHKTPNGCGKWIAVPHKIAHRENRIRGKVTNTMWSLRDGRIFRDLLPHNWNARVERTVQIVK